MAKYITKGIDLRIDGEVYVEGTTVELDEKDARDLMQYLEPLDPPEESDLSEQLITDLKIQLATEKQAREDAEKELETTKRDLQSVQQANDLNANDLATARTRVGELELEIAGLKEPKTTPDPADKAGKSDKEKGAK